MREEQKNHDALKSTVCASRLKLVGLKVSKAVSSESEWQGRKQCFGSCKLRKRNAK